MKKYRYILYKKMWYDGKDYPPTNFYLMGRNTLEEIREDYKERRKRFKNKREKLFIVRETITREVLIKREWQKFEE
jgi:hypothetical protein